MAEYKSIRPGHPYRGSFTGKSVVNGGSLGRREATGKGVFFSLKYLLHDFMKDKKSFLTKNDGVFAKNLLKLEDRPLKVAVQGFGNVGSVAALEAHQSTHLSIKVVAVSDRNVMLYNEDGLDIPGLIEYAQKNRGDLPDTEVALEEAEVKAEVHDRDDVLYLELDALILAALEDQIHKDNVEKVKANIIVEGANAPIESEADASLNDRGVIVIPDILANAGGVIVSYFEWLQGRETQFYSEEEVFKMLYEKMTHTFDTVLPMFFGDPFSLRQNCYIHSVMKLSTVLYRQGKLY